MGAEKANAPTHHAVRQRAAMQPPKTAAANAATQIEPTLKPTAQIPKPPIARPTGVPTKAATRQTMLPDAIRPELIFVRSPGKRLGGAYASFFLFRRCCYALEELVNPIVAHRSCIGEFSVLGDVEYFVLG